MDKAILVVSFGTSHSDTREKTIEKIIADIKAEYTDYRVYSAFTSYIIVKRLREEGIHIDTVEEAFDRLISDGIKNVTVQPTHIIKGIEYEKLCAAAKRYTEYFNEIKIGEPLLSGKEDIVKTAEFIESIKTDGETLVLMGHGTEHSANSVYGILQSYIGDDNIFIGTVEAKPTAYDVAKRLDPHKAVTLTPFMIVAGDHAVNDMAGDEPNSWKNILHHRALVLKYC